MRLQRAAAARASSCPRRARVHEGAAGARGGGHMPASAPRRAQARCNAKRAAPRTAKQRQARERGAVTGSESVDQARRTDFGDLHTQNPLRVLPIGGLGEIGMNCMLIGHYDRYIMLDAGLMFPDHDELGVARVLPDVRFIETWADKIEALIISHGHEDHIGAMPWVVPKLDPKCKIYATPFTMELVQRRMVEHGLWDPERFVTIGCPATVALGPFECETFRVTHSIPDCIGMMLRCEDGNILHTGDWKIDESPIDGLVLDRAAFERFGKEGVSLMMSDSTNVLSPGRTTSESDVADSIMQKVQQFHESGGQRIVATQFASNQHRIRAMKQACDAVGRKMAFIGPSLTSYLEAGWRSGFGAFDPAELISPNDIKNYAPSELFVVTTGSQAEQRAALNLASEGASRNLTLQPDDFIIYSAKCIPGNEKRVQKMMNRISLLGPKIAMGRGDTLHTSGHAYREEQAEIIKMVQPQHFLPVHGEYAFLQEHAALARQNNVKHTTVVRNGQMVGVRSMRSRGTVSSSAVKPGLALLDKFDVDTLYNDGNKGVGTANEMALDERMTIACNGIIVCSLELQLPKKQKKGEEEAQAVDKNPKGNLRARVRMTSRSMWTDNGRVLRDLIRVAEASVSKLSSRERLGDVERVVTLAVKNTCWKMLKKRTDVVVLAFYGDGRTDENGTVARRKDGGGGRGMGDGRARGGGRVGGRGRGRGGGRGRGRGRDMPEVGY